jgi:hypothetical protein
MHFLARVTREPAAMCIRYFKISELQNRCELDPCVSEVFDSESALELNPEVVTLTPGTPCVYSFLEKLLTCFV